MADYESDIVFALSNAAPHNAAEIAELLNLPEHIRGYGHVRQRHVEAAKKRRSALRDSISDRKAKAA